MGDEKNPGAKAPRENNSNEERSEESIGNDYRNKKVITEREEQKSPPLRPKCWGPGKKHGSGERISVISKQEGRQVR